VTPTRKRRLLLVTGIVAGVSIAGALALNAFRRNVTFFFDPTQVAQGEVAPGQAFRLGGMVTQGSLARAPGSLEVRFIVTDFSHQVPVSYTGVLPDTFKDEAEVVLKGRLIDDANFQVAPNGVMAKCPSKYEEAPKYDAKTGTSN